MQYVIDPTQMEWGWESRVIDATHLAFDAHDGRFVLNENLDATHPRCAATDSTITTRLQPIHATEHAAAPEANGPISP